MVPDIKYIIPQILIVNADQSKWIKDEQGAGCVDFLDRALLDSFLDAEDQPQDILEKCHDMDAGYVYANIQEIKSERDIENLEWASGGFHDARIAKKEIQEDGALYLRFDGIWFGSTVILQDGFVYFIDDNNMKVERVTPGYCYFRARHMKYCIIPD